MKTTKNKLNLILVLVFGIFLWNCGNIAEASSCGDGQLDEGEICDDGNTISEDGCSSICETEFGEGSTSSPVSLAFGTTDLPYSGEVGEINSYKSYYEITGLTAGDFYKIATINHSASSYFTVYSDNAFSTELESDANRSIDYESVVIVAPANGIVYIKTWKLWEVDSYTLTVEHYFTPDSVTAVEGTDISPMVLNFGSDFPFVGHVDGDTPNPTVPNSYYQINGLTAGTSYTITTLDHTDASNLKIYSDTTFDTTSWLNSANSSAKFDKSLTVTAPGSSLYILTSSENAVDLAYTLNIQ
ncbi:MAG: myxococcus cysteine-rich repeat containing protein [Spirochaetia bacterium]|nr:myxococcus cysteine-rich repeat containing protein [Spirochaetia bacterium]